MDSIAKYEEMENNKPTLQEVKDHFKGAECIQSVFSRIVIKGVHDIQHVSGSYHGFGDDDNDIELWSKERGYAEIVTYKQPQQNDFKEITDNIADLLAYKNNKYGDSALNPLSIFNGKSKVGQRVDDKLSRIQNSDTLAKNDIVDLIGYLILICKENDWKTFDEFKD